LWIAGGEVFNLVAPPVKAAFKAFSDFFKEVETISELGTAADLSAAANATKSLAQDALNAAANDSRVVSLDVSNKVANQAIEDMSFADSHLAIESVDDLLKNPVVNSLKGKGPITPRTGGRGSFTSPSDVIPPKTPPRITPRTTPSGGGISGSGYTNADAFVRPKVTTTTNVSTSTVTSSNIANGTQHLISPTNLTSTTSTVANAAKDGLIVSPPEWVHPNKLADQPAEVGIPDAPSHYTILNIGSQQQNHNLNTGPGTGITKIVKGEVYYQDPVYVNLFRKKGDVNNNLYSLDAENNRVVSEPYNEETFFAKEVDKYDSVEKLIALKGKKILIVSDEEIFRNVADIFNYRGANVLIARTIEEAEKVIGTQNFDLIYIDLNIDEHIKILQPIRSKDSNVPVIAISDPLPINYTSFFPLPLYLWNMGYSGCLLKPIGITKMIDRSVVHLNARNKYYQIKKTDKDVISNSSKSVDFIKNQKLDYFIKEAQTELKIQNASQLTTYNELQGKIAKINGKEYLIKNVRTDKALSQIQTMKILNWLGLAKTTFILPKDKNFYTLIIERPLGIKLKDISALSITLSDNMLNLPPDADEWLNILSQIMGKQYATLRDAVYEFDKAVLREKGKLTSFTEQINSYFDSIINLDIIVELSPDKNPSRFYVVDPNGFNLLTRGSYSTKEEIEAIIKSLEQFVSFYNMQHSSEIPSGQNTTSLTTNLDPFLDTPTTEQEYLQMVGSLEKQNTGPFHLQTMRERALIKNWNNDVLKHIIIKDYTRTLNDVVQDNVNIISAIMLVLTRPDYSAEEFFDMINKQYLEDKFFNISDYNFPVVITERTIRLLEEKNRIELTGVINGGRTRVLASISYSVNYRESLLYLNEIKIMSDLKSDDYIAQLVYALLKRYPRMNKISMELIGTEMTRIKKTELNKIFSSYGFEFTNTLIDLDSSDNTVKDVTWKRSGISDTTFLSLIKPTRQVVKVTPVAVYVLTETGRTIRYGLSNRQFEEIEDVYGRYLSLTNPKSAFLERIQDKKLLDMGIGRSNFVSMLRTKGFDAYGLDIHIVDEFKSENYYYERPANDTKLDDESFDVIFSTASVLDYERDNIDMFKSTLEEILRILKSGGSFFFTISQTKEDLNKKPSFISADKKITFLQNNTNIEVKYKDVWSPFLSIGLVKVIEIKKLF